MMRFATIAVVAALAGCASFDGSSLVPGKSTAAEAEAVMGAPVQRLPLPDGGQALYFSRLPYGRAVFVVAVGRDSVVRSVEQRLERANFAKVAAGISTQKDVRELFGPPAITGRLPRLQREWWEYPYFDAPYRRVIYVQFSDDGVVREVYDMLDPDEEKRTASDSRN